MFFGAIISHLIINKQSKFENNPKQPEQFVFYRIDLVDIFLFGLS